MADTDAGRAERADSSTAAVRHLLTSVQQALSLPLPHRHSDRPPYLALLEERVHVAEASISRLLADPNCEEIDYLSEGDHILHLIADLPPTGYRHHCGQSQ